MKDKIVKTGHKKPYYTLRRLGKVSLFFALFAAAFATPVLITYSMNAQATAAENTSLGEPAPEESSSSLELVL